VGCIAPNFSPLSAREPLTSNVVPYTVNRVKGGFGMNLSTGQQRKKANKEKKGKKQPTSGNTGKLGWEKKATGEKERETKNVESEQHGETTRKGCERGRGLSEDAGRKRQKATEGERSRDPLQRRSKEEVSNPAFSSHYWDKRKRQRETRRGET